LLSGGRAAEVSALGVSGTVATGGPATAPAAGGLFFGCLVFDLQTQNNR
jgi:hypothetical protein